MDTTNTLQQLQNSLVFFGGDGKWYVHRRLVEKWEHVAVVAATRHETIKNGNGNRLIGCVEECELDFGEQDREWLGSLMV